MIVAQTRQRAAPRFYPELESLRGLAALTVVWLHANILAGGRADFQSAHGVIQIVARFLTPGNAAVVLFFVLSGFVLSQTIHPDSFDFLKYGLRRLFRLMPALWVAIAFAVAANFALDQPVDWGAAFQATYFADFHIDPPLWSLNVEFYLSVFLLPVLALATPRLGTVGNLLLQAALFGYFLKTGLMSYAYLFHLGCLIPTIGQWSIVKIRENSVILAIVISSVLFFVSNIAVEMSPADYFTYGLALAAMPSFLAVSYLVAIEDGAVPRFMRTGPVRFIGRISYSVYILHWPVIHIVLKFIQAQIGVLLVATLATIAAATICYYGVELPFITLGRRLTRRPSMPSREYVDGKASPASTASSPAGTDG
ncbi:MAG TPA: acyltransferase [Stellaceae bacterium]|nr:acyltransferase [Stellaceae bacterium]